MTSRTGHFTAFYQPPAAKMRPALAIKNSARLLALLVFLAGGVRAAAAAQSVSNAAPEKILWSDIRQFGVEGRGWTNTKSFYDRLPARAEALVRQPVWDLSHDSAGMC